MGDVRCHYRTTNKDSLTFVLHIDRECKSHVHVLDMTVLFFSESRESGRESAAARGQRWRRLPGRGATLPVEGLGGWDLAFGVWGLRFGVWGLGFMA